MNLVKPYYQRILSLKLINPLPISIQAHFSFRKYKRPRHLHLVSIHAPFSILVKIISLSFTFPQRIIIQPYNRKFINKKIVAVNPSFQQFIEKNIIRKNPLHFLIFSCSIPLHLYFRCYSNYLYNSGIILRLKMNMPFVSFSPLLNPQMMSIFTILFPIRR